METTIETPVRTKRQYNPALIKPIHERITDSSYYKEAFGDRPLTDAEMAEIAELGRHGLYTHDRIITFIKFIKYGLENWCDRWCESRKYNFSTLEYHVLIYGVMHGTMHYMELNQRKTAHFDHSSETQRKWSLISAEKTRGSKEHSIRTIGYWIKKGYTEKEAKMLVRNVQTTNTLETYQKKYGEELGAIKFRERNDNWSALIESMPGVSEKRSTSLESYIAKHGIEKGTQMHADMLRNKKCNTPNKFATASAESLTALADIISLLDKYEMSYYLGVEGNHEWSIFDEDTQKRFYYDLAIPALSTIIEYHGECYHPNPNWDQETWDKWKQLYANATADEKYAFDTYKKELAELNGWFVYEMYSSSVPETRRVILEDFAKLGYVL